MTPEELGEKLAAMTTYEANHFADQLSKALRGVHWEEGECSAVDAVFNAVLLADSMAEGWEAS